MDTTTYTPKEPNVFGIHDFVSEEEPDHGYQASHTGMLFYPKVTFDQGDPPMVLSFVNGTMCVNPLGDFVCAANFDHAAAEVLDNYRLPNPDEPSVAYFNPATKRYHLEETPFP